MRHLTEKNPKYSNLQISLIRSLEAVIKHAPNPNAIKRVNSALKGVHIPEDRYSLVLDTIFLILRARPDLWENPKWSELEAVCRHCAIKMGSLNENELKEWNKKTESRPTNK